MPKFFLSVALLALFIAFLGASTSQLSYFLNQDIHMKPGEVLTSPNGMYMFAYQTDGNLVIYKKAGNQFTATWNSNTYGRPSNRLIMQGDGNLVLYDAANGAVWNSKTAKTTQTTGPFKLVMRDNGFLQILDVSQKTNENAEGTPIFYLPIPNELPQNTWLFPEMSLISEDKQSVFVVQRDCNLVLYRGGVALWATGTARLQCTGLVFQGDGNLVLYNGNSAVWSSLSHEQGIAPFRLKLTNEALQIFDSTGALINSVSTVYQNQALKKGTSITSANGRFILAVQQDGNIVIYRNDQVPIWDTRTAGKQITGFVMQADGNLVLYNGNIPLWHSGTHGMGSQPYKLVLTNNGEAQIIDGRNQILWIAPMPSQIFQDRILYPGMGLQSPDKRTVFYLQKDCNCVIYNTQGQPLFHTNTHGKACSFLIIQGDGNLVLYNGNTAIWHSGSHGKGVAPYTLQLTNAQALQVVDGIGSSVWSSNPNLSANPVTYSDQMLWMKYRTRLAYEIAKRYCQVGNPNCDFVQNSQFQMIMTPTDALWHVNKNQLNKDVVGFASAWEVGYKPVSTSYDGVISELYKKYLLSSGNLNQYKLFMTQQPTQDGVFYDWQEQPTSENLANFVNRCAAKPADSVGFSFKIDISSPTYLNNDWENFGEYMGGKGFIRPYLSEQTLNDNENAKNWRLASDSESTFIFGGSKTEYHHVYTTKTVVVTSNKFHFTLDAVDLQTIDVAPSSSWFNKQQFLSDRANTQKLGYSGANGKFPLLPKTVVVAYKPRVEIIVSKSVYEGMKKDLQDQAVLGWLVGGAKFRAPNIKELRDDGTFTRFTPEEMAKNNNQADEIIFEEIPASPKIEKKPHKDLLNLYELSALTSKPTDERLEEFFDETSAPIQVEQRRRKRSNDEAEVSSEWLFRRRVRHETIVHETVVEVPEGSYRVSWISNSDVPQILAVISDRV